MRIWALTLLILLFAGVSAGSAYDINQGMTDEVILHSSVDLESPLLSEFFLSHHDKCCNKSGDQTSASSCAADCTSLFVDSAEFVFQVSIEHEVTPIPIRTALIADLKDQPPKFL